VAFLLVSKISPETLSVLTLILPHPGIETNRERRGAIYSLVMKERHDANATYTDLSTVLRVNNIGTLHYSSRDIWEFGKHCSGGSFVIWGPWFCSQCPTLNSNRDDEQSPPAMIIAGRNQSSTLSAQVFVPKVFIFWT
jgi:hypothetical protein